MYAPPPVWSFAPFVILLLVIAVFPLIPAVSHFWEHNRNKFLISLVLAVLMLLYYAFVHGGIRDHRAEAPPVAEAPHGEAHAAAAPAHPETLLTGLPAVKRVLEHAVLNDFIPFIVLLFSLYTISGGILLRGDIAARPSVNCAFLGVGAILASFIGTTGASMLLIRPVLKTNAERRHKVHTVIFFIFLVSNIGGCLTPLGDPPLFLGYLRGVEFWWTLRLFLPWLVLNGVLLAVYFIWDTLAYRHETPRDVQTDLTQIQPLSLVGGINFVWLLGVVACVALVDTSRELPLLGIKPFPYAREAILLALTAASWFTTPGNKTIRSENQFNFTAILEVACLFIGIFICMQAPLEYLEAEGGKLGLNTPAHFFWAAGSLSSFLDNAPTYVVFFKTAIALTQSLPPEAVAGAVVAVHDGVILDALLLAVSMGAVFMGANTYIGNGPNFMVKTIAEQSGVKMPSFFGYMLYSVGILIPLFVAVTFLFLS